MLRATFKIGKKLCFPDVPCNWVRWRAAKTELLQDNRLKNNILFPGPQSQWIGWDEQSSYYYSCTESGTGIKTDRGNGKFKNCDREDRGRIGYGDGHKENIGYRFGHQEKCRCYIDPTRHDQQQVDCYSWSHENFNNISNFLENEAAECGYNIENRRSVIEKGKPFDVLSLLFLSSDDYLVRNNGKIVKVDSLRGKKILVCCFFVPVFWLSTAADHIRGIPTAAASACCDEIVVVVRMRRSWANDEHSFNHFLSGFPSSCLTVPFSDSLRRDYVCNSIGLCPRRPQAILVDSSNYHQHMVVAHGSMCFFNGFFDFASERLEIEEIPSWWKAHSQLDALLDSHSDDLLCNIINTFTQGGAKKKISISQLKEKLVGLYLCYDGSFIRTLDIISQECKARNLEFEIVLVYLPYKVGVDPQLFQEAINHVLHNLNIKSASDWWVSPFNDFVSRKFWDLRDSCWGEDQLIIVQPDNFPEPYGKHVIRNFGINAYPFTRESIVLRELKALRALTLESLLVYGSRDYLLLPPPSNCNNNGNGNGVDQVQVPVTELQGKTVFLYVDNVQSPDLCLYNALLQWYNNRNNETRNDFEVVFVHFNAEDRVIGKFVRPVPMPWLSCPFDPKHTAFVEKHILKGRPNVLAAFGKEGRIITLHALDLLKESSCGFPSYEYENDGLRSEVIDRLERICDVDMTYGDLKTWLDYPCSNMHAD